MFLWCIKDRTKASSFFGVRRGQPYFEDIPKLWREYSGTRRHIRSVAVDGLEVVADFGRHFPEDCQ